MANKHKNVFNFISHLGIPIKIRIRFYYTPIRKIKMKRQKMPSVGEDIK